jgi:hypothetical protein
MERQQIDRFFKTDSLNRTFAKALVIFNDTARRQLETSGAWKAGTNATYGRLIEGLLDVLQTYKSRYFFYRAMTNLNAHRVEPFLTAAIELDKGGNVVAKCDPLEEEEIALLKHEWLPGPGHFFQPVCSYSLEADPMAGRYNGDFKGRLVATRYDIDATIWGDGKFRGAVTGIFEVDSMSTQISNFDLSTEMKVDSVLDSAGHKLTFRQYKDGDDYLGFWLLFPRMLQVGETVPLTFYYAGDVAERELGIYFVYESNWCPRTGRERARFKMRFRTRADYGFVATGRSVSRTTVGDTLITEWEVTEPTDDVSFNIGFFEKYSFSSDIQTPVDVLYSEDLHRALAQALSVDMIGAGRHMEKQVASDVTASLSYFSRLFGSYPHERITVSEVLLPMSIAYPASLHLSVGTWITTDQWGYERLHRAHEVAHQWWGAGVGYESYRDKWLSEGFAEYSSFMYLQAVAGNQQFLDRLDEIRKEVLAERKTAGAIALGFRAGNYKEPDHYDVLVYEKGALVLHMLRQLFLNLETMREDRFANMMQDYYSTYVNKDPSTADFKQIVEKHAGVDMSWFFDQWVYGNDIPTYTFRHSVIADSTPGEYRANVHVEQTDVPATFKMYVPLEIDYENGQKQYVRLMVDQPAIEMSLLLPSKPKKLKLNPLLSVLADVKQ